ncbi:MAG: sortase [Acidobacteriota bacterium]
MNTISANPKNMLLPGISLFAGTFLFAFLLAFGLIIAVLMGAPVMATLFARNEPYTPLLPLSPNQEEEIFDITRNRGRQLFPPLTNVDHVSADNWIRIPSLDIHVPIVMSASLKDADVLATLDKGAALYPNGVLPGRLGNAFIAAHSTGEPWKGKYRFAFLRINELEPGNIIHLDYEGTRYTYTITSKDIIVPSPDYAVISDRPVPTLTLMACWPLWSTEKRMLVHAELTNITQLTTP